MNDRFDLNQLMDFCRKQGLSFEAAYSEASDELELEIHSAAPSERLYMKRVPSIEYFIEQWLLQHQVKKA